MSEGFGLAGCYDSGLAGSAGAGAWDCGGDCGGEGPTEDGLVEGGLEEPEKGRSLPTSVAE